MENEEEEAPPEEARAGNLILSAYPEERDLPANGRTSWDLQLRGAESGRHNAMLSITPELFSEVEGPPEWVITLYDATGPIWEYGPNAPSEIDVMLDGTRAKELELELKAPKGARFGDRLTVTVEIWRKGEAEDTAALEFTASAVQSVLALKTSIGYEKKVADKVASKAKAMESGLFAILSPANLRGYIFLEGMNTDRLRESIKGIRRARGLVDGETNYEEINHFLTPKPLVSGIMPGDVVELVAGPFKGEKARVQQINESKEEITVELLEAMVPIPVTVRGDHVRVLEKER